MPYSEQVLDHFHNPRHAYRMADPDVIGQGGTPESGPFLLVFLKVREARIQEASFQTYGCAAAIAAGSALVERLTGLPLEDARRIDDAAVDASLGGLPMEKKHCAALAARALNDALGRVS